MSAHVANDTESAGDGPSVNRNTHTTDFSGGMMVATDSSLTQPRSTNGDASQVSRRMALRALFFVGIGMVSMALSIVGLALLYTADYFHDPGPYAYNSWQGYDVKSFVGLMMFMTLAPLGFISTYSGLQALARRQGVWGLTAFAALGVASIMVGMVGMAWGKETMECFGIFCVGSAEKWKEIPNERPEAGLGFLSTIGLSAFFSLVPFGVIIAYQVVRAFLSKRKRDGADAESVPLLREAAVAAHVPHWQEKQSVAIALGVSIFFSTFVFMITTFYIPNSWEYFTAARIAKNARLQVTLDPQLCNTDYVNFTCSEVSWATFTTTQLRVSTNLVLKFYPGNVFFFTYLLSLIAFVAVIRGYRRGRLFLKRRVVLNFTVGELIVVSATVVMISAFFYYWLHDHNYNGYWQGGPERGLSNAERWARALGQLAVVFMSLLFFPASRNSVVHRLFGTSWEASLWAHRVLGYGMLAASFAHMVAWYVRYGQLGLLPQDVFEVPMSLPSSIDNFTVPMNTLTTWLLFLCMGFFALEPVRRRWFELFYYTHMIAAYLAIPAVLWHAAAGWEYLLPGVTVWFIDRLVRMYRSSSLVEVVSVSATGGVTEIQFLQPTMSLSPGQYVFVNIPEISVFEWHPFTISSGIGSKNFSLHIKSMGAKTWTERLLALCVAKGPAAAATSLTLAVDGPYGHPIAYDDYKRVVLVAGGIGITPCASIFSMLKGSSSVTPTLLWSLREQSLIDAFQQQLGVSASTAAAAAAAAAFSGGTTMTTDDDSSLKDLDTATAGGVIPMGPPICASAKIFLTRNGRPEMGVPTCSIERAELAHGRPSYEVEFADAGRGVEPHDVLVFACGPDSLVQIAANTAKRFGYNFHEETFLL